MIDTYQTNDNFFVCITAGDFMWPSYIFDWFYQVPSARFRLIVDKELNDQVASLKMVEDISPGVETIGVVSTPWAKTYDAFVKLTTLNAQGTPHPIQQLFNFDLSNFNNFVNQIPSFEQVPQLWFTPATPATEWMSYINSEGILRTPRFILRKEFMSKDIKQIQDFFCTQHPLGSLDGISPLSREYRIHYSSESKLLISKIFQTDIEQYGFTF